MSLSYGLYMAASVFLLQLQAIKSADPRIFERLHFCIQSLESVSTVNTVLQQAVQIIRAELAKINLALSASTSHQLSDSGSFNGNTPESEAPADQGFSHGSFPAPDVLWSPTGLHEFAFDNMDFSGDMMDAFRHLEPISANVGSKTSI